MFDASEYVLSIFVFQRALGFIYLTAFLVAARQFVPLLGEDGLLPVPHFVERVAFKQAPSLFFFTPTDRTFNTAAWAGVALSLLATLGVSELFGTWFSMLVWFLLWLLYLSFVNVGQVFYGFGWESLLVEAGFLAIFLGGIHTTPSFVMVLLLRWLLFRVMFGAGLIKLRGDSCWRDFTCMEYHYETQPMPNPLSWHFHHLPAWVHKAGVLANHVVELAVPFFYFAPQPIAAVAGALTIAFMGWLVLSGNFSWLNVLTMVLAIPTLHDAWLSAFIPISMPATFPPSTAHSMLIWGLALVAAVLSIQPIRNMISSRQRMNAAFDPLKLVNTYGAFGSITRERYEIVVEGTDEAVLTESTEWQAYTFKGKPTDVSRRPPQWAPYHLRLDWQMWFAAMSAYYQHPWFVNFVAKLLQGDEKTHSLLREVPFPDEPPRYVRARLFRYRFTTPAERERTGNWWKRGYVRNYFPPTSLDDEGFREVLQKQDWM